MSSLQVAHRARAGFGRPTPALLGAVVVAEAALVVAVAAFGFTNDHVPRIQVVLYEWMTVPYVVAGIVAWLRRPASRLGPLLIASGLGIGLSGLQYSHTEPWQTIGEALDLLPAALFLHVYLAFPDGRLRSRSERLLVATAYPTAVGVQVVMLVLGSSHHVLAIGALSDLRDSIRRAQVIAMAAILIAGVVVLGLRRNDADRARRHGMALVVDLYAAALLLGAALFIDAAAEGPGLPYVQRATWAVVGLAPIVFLLGLLDARLARSSIGDLIIELRSDLEPERLRSALARALRDPTLSLAYWLPASRVYVDLDGRPVDVRAGEATVIERDGAPVAALLHDGRLEDEPELLAAVSAAAGIALENARLHAELASRVEEVRGSQARIIEAGDTERRRLERDLHDGAQQRLVALSIALRLAEKRINEDPEAAGTLVAAAREELAQSLEELRELAQGIHPAMLDHGLALALEALAARAPVSVSLSVDLEDRLPQQVETAAYFVASEALANVGKYAQASTVSISVLRRDGCAVIEISDDGVGGADRANGSGLRGLADRIEALGGRFEVQSPLGAGTMLTAELPCAS